MKQIELELWEKYSKYKSTFKKCEILEELRFVGGLESFNKLCDEFMKSKSHDFRNTTSQILEYLFVKLSPDSQSEDNYNKLLEKYKINSISHYWFRDFKKIAYKDLIKVLHEKILYFNSLKTDKRQRFQVKFKLTEKIEGVVNMNFIQEMKVIQDNYHSINIGYISVYRDAMKGYLNDNPRGQEYCPYLFYQPNGFKLIDETIVLIEDYFNSVIKLESLLASIKDENDVIQYLKNQKLDLFSMSDLALIKCLMNYNKSNNNIEAYKLFANIGLKIVEDTGGWVDYLQEASKI